jgi:hypothetical protein
MNAIIKLNVGYPNTLFHTKAEWDSYSEGHKKYHRKVWGSPEKFPCIAVATNVESNDIWSGRYYQHHYFIYDFTLENEKE